MSGIIIDTGVYETLISKAIEEKLQNFPESEYLIQEEDIDSAESYKMLTEYLLRLFREY